MSSFLTVSPSLSPMIFGTEEGDVGFVPDDVEFGLLESPEASDDASVGSPVPLSSPDTVLSADESSEDGVSSLRHPTNMFSIKTTLKNSIPKTLSFFNIFTPFHVARAAVKAARASHQFSGGCVSSVPDSSGFAAIFFLYRKYPPTPPPASTTTTIPAMIKGRAPTPEESPSSG